MNFSSSITVNYTNVALLSGACTVTLPSSPLQSLSSIIRRKEQLVNSMSGPWASIIFQITQGTFNYEL